MMNCRGGIGECSCNADEYLEKKNIKDKKVKRDTA